MVPGEKLPKDPPLEFEGQVEKSRAQSSNDDSPEAIIFIITLASDSVFTRMWRAVALTLSPGGP